MQAYTGAAPGASRDCTSLVTSPCARTRAGGGGAPPGARVQAGEPCPHRRWPPPPTCRKWMSPSPESRSTPRTSSKHAVCSPPTPLAHPRHPAHRPQAPPVRSGWACSIPSVCGAECSGCGGRAGGDGTVALGRRRRLGAKRSAWCASAAALDALGHSTSRQARGRYSARPPPHAQSIDRPAHSLPRFCCDCTRLLNLALTCGGGAARLGCDVFGPAPRSAPPPPTHLCQRVVHAVIVHSLGARHRVLGTLDKGQPARGGRQGGCGSVHAVAPRLDSVPAPPPSSPQARALVPAQAVDAVILVALLQVLVHPPGRCRGGNAGKRQWGACIKAARQTPQQGSTRTASTGLAPRVSSHLACTSCGQCLCAPCRHSLQAGVAGV